MRLLRRGGWTARVVLGLCLVMACSACSGAPSPGGSRSDVPVTLGDFHVRVGKDTVASGPVTFDIHNRGPSTHEFVIVRTDLGSSDLPLGADGLTVDEDSPEIQFVSEDPDLDVGDDRLLEVDLPAGHYVLYCNLEGHYLGGMH